MRQRLVDALIGVLQIDVLPDHGNFEIFPGSNDPLDESAPLGHLRGRGIKPEQAADRIVQFFILEREREFVDCVVDVSHLDHGVERNITKKRKLLANFQNERLFRPAKQHVGLEADLSKFRDALLRRLGFQLAGRLYERNQRHVHDHDVLGPHLELKLSNRLEKR